MVVRLQRRVPLIRLLEEVCRCSSASAGSRPLRHSLYIELLLQLIKRLLVAHGPLIVVVPPILGFSICGRLCLALLRCHDGGPTPSARRFEPAIYH